jgi:hypothetical protein
MLYVSSYVYQRRRRLYQQRRNRTATTGRIWPRLGSMQHAHTSCSHDREVRREPVQLVASDSQRDSFPELRRVSLGRGRRQRAAAEGLDCRRLPSNDRSLAWQRASA